MPTHIQASETYDETARAQRSLLVGSDGGAASLVIEGDVTLSSEVEVKNDTGNPVPVSGTVTSNLGTLNGAATSAKQDTIIGHLDGVESLLDGLATSGETQPTSLPRVSSATNGAASVTGSSTSVLSSNASRLEFTVVNDSDAVIYLKLGTSAALNSGIRLNANGGSYTDDKYTGAVTAITATGTKVLTFVEL